MRINIELVLFTGKYHCGCVMDDEGVVSRGSFGVAVDKGKLSRRLGHEVLSPDGELKESRSIAADVASQWQVGLSSNVK